MGHKNTALAAILLSGCTLASGASDFEVDPTAFVRDLDYTFVNMIPHAGDAMRPDEQSGFLDVAVVDETDLLQARARIILGPAVTPFPDERLVLHNGLIPGDQRLFFFADNDGDGTLDGSADVTIEHSWVEDVPPEGVGSFPHNTNFKYFGPKAYTPLNGALVLELPVFNAVPDAALLKCLSARLGKKQVDVTLTLIEQDRQVGLLRRHAGSPLPKTLSLSGVLDGGSMYQIQVLVDGKVQKTIERMAPATDDLVLKAGEWFPGSLTARDCL